MTRFTSWCVAFSLICGCSRTVAPPVVTTQGPPLTVSGDDPVIRLPGGEQIGVDSIPPGESVELVETRTVDARGQASISYDFAPKRSVEAAAE